MSLLDFLNQNSGAFAVIFSAIVAIATIVYALLTYSLVSETKMMRKTQTEPKISAIIQPDERYINWVNLIIQNIGLGPAYDLKFDVNPDFTDRGYKLSDIGFIKNGLPYFAPSQKIEIFLQNMAEADEDLDYDALREMEYERKLKICFKIKITYENCIHDSLSDEYLIDFSKQRGLTQLGEPSVYTIAKKITLIQKDIHDISTEFTRRFKLE